MIRLLSTTMAALVALSGLSGAAQAEVLTIEGLTPANSPDFVQIQSIAIERFGGGDGRALAFELEDRLLAVTLFGKAYFDILDGRSAVRSDALLTGNVTAGVEQYETTAKRRRCVERNDKGRCVTHKNIKTDCLTRTIDYRAQVRVTRYDDGRRIYTERFPETDEQTICFGDDEDFASSESVIRNMVSATANAVRADLAPKQYRRDIRILESRKGMTKTESNFFKAAIRMTKSNPAEACRMWDEAAANGQVHISLGFNRGLCAEQRGDLEAALDLYNEAGRISPGKSEVTEALRRVNDHRQALGDWELRQTGDL